MNETTKYSLDGYSGGADTTVSAQYAFFLAMVLNPGQSAVLHFVRSALKMRCRQTFRRRFKQKLTPSLEMIGFLLTKTGPTCRTRTPC